MVSGLSNLHNHTPFSDGAYTVDELVTEHLKLGMPIAAIGITDHLFCTPSSREVHNEKEFDKVFGKEARSYVAMVKEARQRWAGKVPILCGAEINWPLNKGLLDQVRAMLTGIDYVLFEFVDWAGLTTLANQARRWPCPVVQFPNTSMDQVVRTLANARIFYEVSAKFLPLVDHEAWFKTVPNHRVQVTIGADTHDDLDVLRELPGMHQYLIEHGLGEKILIPQVREEAVAVAH
jgi:hypothetical protein